MCFMSVSACCTVQFLFSSVQGRRQSHVTRRAIIPPSRASTTTVCFLLWHLGSTSSSSFLEFAVCLSGLEYQRGYREKRSIRVREQCYDAISTTWCNDVRISSKRAIASRARLTIRLTSHIVEFKLIAHTADKTAMCAANVYFSAR